ncbi:MAG: histidine--tRNA ligase [Bacilli bacterium]|nr:histidine--tRNA ligase [Bacilli bacterium]
MANYQKIKGTQDFIGVDAMKIRKFESIASLVAKSYGIKEIITPIIEDSNVFVKNVGEDSDIVKKEMYTFLDKGERSITLRPEGTAAIARCFIENKMYANPGVTKLFYYGPMFRYERPQTGRYRQFNQFGVEYYGTQAPLMDVEIISSAFAIFKKLGINDIKIKINSIGDSESRKNFSNALKEYFRPYINDFCEDCKRRIDINPLRILDCKVDNNKDDTKEIIKNAPTINNYLTKDSLDYFEYVLKGLDNLNIPYVVDYNLVRGLDYYTDTVFEFVYYNDQGQESLALGGGGRYANLIKDMCGVDVNGMGYAFGVERLINLMDNLGLNDDCIDYCDAVIIGLDYESKLEAFKLAKNFREEGIITEMEYASFSLKSQFKLADRVNARFIIIIGEEERINNVYTVKDKKLNTQENVNKNDILKYIQNK